MNETECAYIAGLIESKGSIMLLKDNRNKYPSPCVSISSSAFELLNYIKTTYGKGSIRKKINSYDEVNQVYYDFTLKRNDAIEFLNSIFPYLTTDIKKQRANLIINKYKNLTPRNGRYTDELLKLKEEFYEEFIALK